MATVFERTVEKNIVFNLAQKCSLGEIVLKAFYAAGYDKNQTSLYRSVEPEGYYQVINYPPSFTEKIDQCIDNFLFKKLNPQPVERVTEIVTTEPRKRTRKPIKIHSEKPSNK